MDSRTDLDSSDDETISLARPINPVTNSDEIMTKTAALEAAVKAVGPRVYKLIAPFGETARFYVFGCQGNGKQPQKEVAMLMESIMTKSGNIPHFVLVLGDNMYDWGVASPTDPAFKDCFHEKYQGEHVPTLSRIPFFLIEGNHDGNWQNAIKANLTMNPTGEKTEINEVEHTYVDDTEEKVKTYTQDELELNKLQQWNMPYFFYSLIVGGLQIFCLNSNTYAKDFINLQLGETNKDSIIATNQAAWLKVEYDKARQAGRKVAFALHHPPHHTSGKRAFHYDWNHYLYPEEFAKAKALAGSETLSYNTLLADIFKKQGMNADIVFAAHDHFLSYYNNKADSPSRQGACQVTSGGGGGDLQSRKSCAGHPYVSLHLMQTGVTEVSYATMKPDVITIDIHSTKGHHVQFTDKSHKAIRTPSNDVRIETLRELTLKICDQYLTQLKENELQQRSSKEEQHTASTSIYGFFKGVVNTAVGYFAPDKLPEAELICIHDLMAYFNQPTLPPKYASVVSAVHLYTANLLNKETSQSFFFQQLSNECKKQTACTLEKLFETHVSNFVSAAAPGIR